MNHETIDISNSRHSNKIGNIGEQFVKLYYFIKGYEVGDGQPGGFFDVWYASKKTGIIKCVQVKTSRMRTRDNKYLHYNFGLSGSKGIGRKRQISPCDYVLVAISKDGNIRFIFYSHELIIKMDCENIVLKANEVHQSNPDFLMSEELATEIHKQDFEDFEDVEIDLTPSQGLLFCMDKQ